MSTAAAAEADPVVRPRPEHPISRSSISENTLKVLYRLHKTGYRAYLCGGGVRDLLLGRRPKDFDVATDARPEEIRRVFRNSRVIGRRSPNEIPRLEDRCYQQNHQSQRQNDGEKSKRELDRSAAAFSRHRFP